MSKSWSAALFLVFSSTAWAAPTWSQMAKVTDWKHEADADTSDAGKVAIDTATIGGIGCFRASTGSLDLTSASVFSTISDIDSTTKWSTAGVTEAKLLSKTATEYSYYEYLDVPGWTMSSDRFWFLKSTLEKTDTKITFSWDRLVDGGAHAETWKSVKAAHPDAIEPPINVGAWVIEGSSPVKLSYYICTDTGGSIPQFVQTSVTRKTLPDTVSDVAREAKKRK